MTTQPAALILADELEIKAKALGFSLSPHAAELRRLHEVNAEILEALKELVAHTDGKLFAVKHDHVALQNARAAIAKATGEA